jgi:hypothetical protein
MVYRSSSGTLYRTSSSSQNNSLFFRFKKTGNYVGIFLSMLWIVLAIYLYYSINNLNDNTKNKNYYYIIPTLLILIVVIANGIYIYNVNNHKYKNVTEENTEFIENAKSRYANILLTPIYIIIIYLIVMFLL